MVAKAVTGGWKNGWEGKVWRQQIVGRPLGAGRKRLERNHLSPPPLSRKPRYVPAGRQNARRQPPKS